MPTVAEALTWQQRIEKEELINARGVGQFSLRNAVSVVDVPAKFKPGHFDPTVDDKGLKRFDPEENGWDPDGSEAIEFRRCMKRQVAGPRDRQPYPLTSAQEHGWLLAPRGEPADRVRTKKNRMGFGWEFKHPKDWSASTAMPPPVPHELAAAAAVPAASSSLSACPPKPSASSLSASPPPPPVEELTSSVGAARASQVSIATASAVASSLSRASSLPSVLRHPADRLRRREQSMGFAMQESSRYMKQGDRGCKYDRAARGTDATHFDNEFTKAAGVPLYKTLDSQEVILKDVRSGLLAQKWR